MIINNIFNIFIFSTFSLGHFLDPVFRAIFLKFSQNAGFVKYPRGKVDKQKNVENVIIYHCEAPQKISTIFRTFLAIFTLFHLKNRLYLQKPDLCNLPETRF